MRAEQVSGDRWKRGETAVHGWDWGVGRGGHKQERSGCSHTNHLVFTQTTAVQCLRATRMLAKLVQYVRVGLSANDRDPTRLRRAETSCGFKCLLPWKQAAGTQVLMNTMVSLFLSACHSLSLHSFIYPIFSLASSPRSFCLSPRFSFIHVSPPSSRSSPASSLTLRFSFSQTFLPLSVFIHVNLAAFLLCHHSHHSSRHLLCLFTFIRLWLPALDFFLSPSRTLLVSACGRLRFKGSWAQRHTRSSKQHVIHN